MQSPAELHLIRAIAEHLEARPEPTPEILNIGAGKSWVIEGFLVSRGCRFITDRLDIQDCNLDHPMVRNCYQCPAEKMTPVPSSTYDLAFSNYLLEHVEGLTSAVGEIYRVLKPGGVYVASVPNPSAPEFVLAKHTPLWFHKLVRGYAVGEKYYSYEGISRLVEIFTTSGFAARQVAFYSSVEDYLQRFPVINLIARGYDRTVGGLGIKTLMGNVCLVFEKPPRDTPD